MIAHLKGTLTHKGVDRAVIDIGGVGYQAYVSKTGLGNLPSVGGEAFLHIYTHVREDQITLFGFTTPEEKQIFLRLLDVSGIGPKMALSILSGMAPHDVVQAVVKEDLARLYSIPGVGKKTAERIVVDLKDKFLKEFAGIGAQKPVNKPLYNDSLSALVNLGYQRMTAEKILANVSLDDHTSVQSVIKHALKEMGKIS